MKNFLRIFAILLSTSSTFFAQNTPKVIWEKKVVETNFSPNNISNLNGITLSTEGSIFLRASYANKARNGEEYNIKAFDKNGTQLWDISDYKKTPNSNFITRYVPNKYLYVESSSKNFNRDTVLYFDKNFTYLKTLNTNSPNTYALDVEDGVIYATTDKKFIKYDLNGKEEWQYQNNEPTVLVNSVAPYIGLEGDSSIQKRNILILNKNGKKIGRTEPQVYNKIYPTSDKGFWLLTDQNYTQAEYIKFDSTGKQTAKFTASDLPTRWQSDLLIRLNVMQNSGLFSIYMNDKAEIVLVRMMPDGSLKKSVKNLNISDVRDNRITLYYKLVDDNNCMFFCNYIKVSQSSRNNFIGVAKFDDANLGWSKQIGEAPYGNNIRFNLDDEKVFCIIDEYALTRNVTIEGRLTIYNWDGSLRWKQSNQSQPGVVDFKKVNDFIYLKHIITTNEFVTKVRYDNGSLIWIKPVVIKSLEKDIKSDNLGNTYIKYVYCPDTSYSNCSRNQGKIVVSNKNDEVIAEYKEPTMNSSLLTDFGIDKDNNLITLSLESTNNYKDNSYILRKIKFCGNNFSITPPQITGITDACPGEKVKLSIPKTEGVSYQWKRDGKELEIEGKDAVQEVGISGIYTVTVKELTCSNSVTSTELKVNIRSLPNTEIKTAKLVFCQGDKTTLTATTNGTFFQWQRDEKDIPNATTANFEVTQSGQYRLGVRDDKCPQISYSNIIPIEVKPLPEAFISSDIKSVIIEPFSVKMTANAGTGLTYQWAKNDTAIVNATTSIYQTNKTGKFTVTVTKDGCSKTSEPLLISIQIALANETDMTEDEVKIYPNPSQGEFNIKLANTFKGADIQLFNLLGQEIYFRQIEDKIQAQNLSQGTYFLKISKGEKVITTKVVVY